MYTEVDKRGEYIVKKPLPAQPEVVRVVRVPESFLKEWCATNRRENKYSRLFGRSLDDVVWKGLVIILLILTLAAFVFDGKLLVSTIVMLIALWTICMCWYWVLQRKAETLEHENRNMLLKELPVEIVYENYWNNHATVGTADEKPRDFILLRQELEGEHI